MSRQLLAALLLAWLAPTALAGPSSPTTAAVSIGDSYISGEAGRWNGNSISPLGDKDGTDRACLPPGLGCREDTSKVYLGGSDPGCHRSDVAEVLSASLPVTERVNLACSGAVTENVFRAASGGRGQNGEAPQADQLLPVARSRNVELILLSIGGNDLGFASIVSSCLARYTAKLGPCEPSQQPLIDQRAARVTADVGKAIDEIRAVMAQAGYRYDDYRLVLQTYPSVVPRAAEARYPELSPERSTQGCPFYDQDLTWARTKATPSASMVGAPGSSRSSARTAGSPCSSPRPRATAAVAWRRARAWEGSAERSRGCVRRRAGSTARPRAASC